MKSNLPALAVIVAAALWRIAVVHEPMLYNFAPITALAFCGAVFWRDRRWWLAPFAALFLSDLWLNHYHASESGYTWTLGEMGLRALAVAGACGLGRLAAMRRNAATLLVGTLGSSLLFFLVTNTGAWAVDPFYPGNAAGWWQAMTVGHPQFQPTLWFFRNTLAGDLIFTGLFVAATRGAIACQRQQARQV